MPSSQKLEILLKPNCTWMFIGWSSTKFTFFVPIWNSKWRRHFEFHIGTKNVVKFVEDHPMNIHVQFGFNNICSFWEEGIWTFSRSSTQFLYFYADRKFKMAATAEHKLTLDPTEKCSNAFFSETRNIIKAKLYMNVHWMVLNKKRQACRGPSNEHSCTVWL
jgi:hypothetical protein